MVAVFKSKSAPNNVVNEAESAVILPIRGTVKASLGNISGKIIVFPLIAILLIAVPNPIRLPFPKPNTLEMVTGEIPEENGIIDPLSTGNVFIQLPSLALTTLNLSHLLNVDDSLLHPYFLLFNLYYVIWMEKQGL